MPDMNQPNLQAILSDYGADRANAYKNLEQAAYSDEAEKLKREAIDAIYAGLLAEVIGEKDNYTPRFGSRRKAEDYFHEGKDYQIIQSTKALKRWCYGDTEQQL